VEDSASGVRALLAAGVGSVVGITTTSSAADLLAAGAHRAVADLRDPWLVAFVAGGG
jgi:sugar-phosphatase